MSKTKNFVSIEYLTAFGMLYFVGYWHLFLYTEAFPEYNNFFTKNSAQIVLGIFVMVSGFLVAQTKKDACGLLNFYRERLTRVYPMYVFAVALFYICGINDAVSSIKSLMLISAYFGPAPHTLWFITNLMLFYLATPLLLRFVNNPLKYLFFIGAIFIITFLLQVIFRTVDFRMLLYFPCYCLGIYCAQCGFRTKIFNIKYALMLFCLWLFILSVDIDSWTFNQLKNIPMILSCSYLIFITALLNNNKLKSIFVISCLSYSGFAMYIFHRPIYMTLSSLYFPENGKFQILYLITFCLFMVVFISFGIQKINDINYISIDKKRSGRQP